MTLGTAGLLMQEADPCSRALVDSRNGFNELVCLEILWNVRHIWTEGVRSMFNCYKHLAQLILLYPGKIKLYC